ncbi:MAG: hypothetical protein K9W46_05695 [Candidatus Heimdallarchaeum endolithica]|uniref:IFT52 GIFT domain-containing protein n=1 Tax=Candidatus Heimdallarchaeum endolithica TaxID=2876572 RepID=A0A9Y1BSX7_9ARCH|nr:MAG: hypothetical protein K9W46_05695 [Candidatus Heimdallarchaeum endolithica]
MKILFDETQKERGRIFSNFSILEADLTEAGHKIAVLDTFPIKYSSINSADILVFLCPDGSKLYGHEVKNILRFVEEGNILMIFSNAGGDKGLNTNMNSLLKHFGIELIPNQIFDFQSFDFQLESCPVVTKIYPHPITQGVKEITYCSGCSLHINNEVTELARTRNTSDPPSATIMALSQYGDGWVFVCGSYTVFSNKKSGITNRDNRQFARNLFQWAEKQITEKPSKKEIEIKIEPKKEEVSVSKKDKQKEEGISKQEVEVEKKKRKEPVSTTLLSKPEKISDLDIASVLLQIKEIEAEVETFNVDQTYKEIIITDLARKRGIDYAMIQRYLQMKKEEAEKDKKKERVTQEQPKEEYIVTDKIQKQLSESQYIEPESVILEQTKKVSPKKASPVQEPVEKHVEFSEVETSVDNVAHEILVELKEIRKGIEQLNSTILKLFEKEKKK